MMALMMMMIDWWKDLCQRRQTVAVMPTKQWIFIRAQIAANPCIIFAKMQSRHHHHRHHHHSPPHHHHLVSAGSKVGEEHGEGQQAGRHQVLGPQLHRPHTECRECFFLYFYVCRWPKTISIVWVEKIETFLVGLYYRGGSSKKKPTKRAFLLLQTSLNIEYIKYHCNAMPWWYRVFFLTGTPLKS